MKLLLTRKTDDGISTLGELAIEDAFFCYTLERPWLNNIRETSCVPKGIYGVTFTFSGHFQRFMPLLEDVPGRSEIRIHPANWPYQLEGCIAVGHDLAKDAISNSVAVFEPLRNKMKAAWDTGEAITIVIA